MKKILISVCMMLLLAPCVNAEEVVTLNEEETSITVTEMKKNEAKVKFDEYMKMLAPDNVLIMTTPKSFVNYYEGLNFEDMDKGVDYGEIFSIIASHYINGYDVNDECSVSFSNISEDLSKATLNLSCNFENEYLYETMEVTLKWQDEDSKGLELTKQYAEKINSQKLNVITTDLSLIKYLMGRNSQDIDLIDLFDSAASKNIAISNDGIEYYKQTERCGGNGFSLGCSLVFGVGYNGVYYVPVKNIETGVAFHIYIPDDTENTADAYITAAKTRIDNYFGTNDIKIEKNMTLTEYFGEDITEYWEDIMGEYTISQIGNYCYKVIINDNEYDFVIIRDSSKIEEPTHITKDVETGASIQTNSNEVPMDATINIDVIEKTTEVFKNIVEKIKANVDEIMVLDFKLFSKSKNDYITKLNNGEFVVSVPIIDTLKGKKLIAYYITDEGKVEKHPVTVENDVATFTTNHFSIYTIAEDSSIEVPNTYDGIMNSIIMGIIGIIGIGIFFVLKPREN